MLLRFAVSNFLSFAEEVDFNLFPYERLKTHQDHLYETPKVKLLKAAAIYGGNGAGKSNLIKALKYLHLAVVDPEFDFFQAGHRLNDTGLGSASCFELEFFFGERYYSYLLRTAFGGIEEESLYEIDPKEDGQVVLFSRTRNAETGKIDLSVSERYAKTEKDKLLVQVYAEGVLTDQMTFLRLISEKEQFGDLGSVYEYFVRNLHFVFPNDTIGGIASALYLHPEIGKVINNLFAQLDTGAKKVELRTTTFETYYGIEYQHLKPMVLSTLEGVQDYMYLPHETDDVIVTKNEKDQLFAHRVMLVHETTGGEDCFFEFDQESDGTQRILELLPIVIYLTVPGMVVFVDEIGRSLHPKLLKSLIRLILDQQLEGQLIFTTHDVNLLDLSLFRQDEIWFVEKNHVGGSRAYPMSDFKPRYDLDIRKGYLSGRFGAVPALDQLANAQLKLEYATEE